MQERKIHTKSPIADISPQQIVFLLHGYGADGADLIDLSSPFSMVLPYAKFISPDAPSDCKMSPMGKEWFPIEEIPNGAINASNELLSLIKQECDKESLKFEDVLLIGFAIVLIGFLPFGLSKSLETCIDPNAVSSRVLGIGVALIIKISGG